MNISVTLLMIILGVIILLLIVCITILVLHIIKFRKYVDKYNNIWSKFENKNIEKDIENLIEHMEKTRLVSKECKDICYEIDEKISRSIQKIGLVKYDAYESGSNGLSFSLAMLDEQNNGALINSIYTRNGCNIYAKEIRDGLYSGDLSEEEEKSLQIAKNKKTYM